ncbi:uncharacterized protein LOC124938960 [Impatiens glandulifera]|uniref:uncharacterized protein LOC124938960 n=1 Tax=Impatiens glandulifera TaxID=253017 RepID=UPI001FB12F0C|nr:uncharacterized protein LOC124938960 [Impatiens glandulifera]
MDTKCSRTSQLDSIEDDEENDDEESDDQESHEKKPTIRPYVRSKLPRLRWTPELHLRFVHAVERLGGHDRATPKLVLQLLDIKGLNIAHVKSHLQMYRSKKIDDPTKGIFYQNYLGGGNQKMYNIDRLPGLQGFNYSRGLSTFRSYGDHVSYNHLTSWTNKPYIDRNSSFNDDQRSWLHKTFEEKFIGNIITANNCNSHTGIPHFADVLKSSPSSIKLSPLIESRAKEDPNSTTTVCLPHEFEITRSTFLDRMNLKRKEASNSSIDLNLSLGLKSRVEEGGMDDEGGEELNGNLSLSLFSQSGHKSRRLKEGDVEYARRASTLDLTI